MKKFAVILLTIVFTFNVQAEQKSSKESIEKLMNLMEVSKMLDSMQLQVSQIFSNMSLKMDISANEKPAFDKHVQKLQEIMSQELKWDKFKGPMIDIYAKHFSEEEIQGLIKFYSSDLGKGMTKKMPLVMQDSMLFSQQLMQNIMPKIQTLAVELKADVEELRANKEAK